MLYLNIYHHPLEFLFWTIEPIQNVVFKWCKWIWFSIRVWLNLYRMLYLNLYVSLQFLIEEILNLYRMLYLNWTICHTTMQRYTIEPIQNVVFKYSQWRWFKRYTNIEPIQNVVFKYFCRKRFQCCKRLNLYRMLYLNSQIDKYYPTSQNWTYTECCI